MNHVMESDDVDRGIHLQENQIYVYPALFLVGNQAGIEVIFPDLPGCVAYGENEGMAYVEAKEALAHHLRGLEGEPPEPTPVDDLDPDPYLREEEKGVFVLISVSVSPSSGSPSRIHLHHPRG